MEIRGPKTETAPVELVEDTILASLFTAPTTPPKPCVHSKLHRSSFTSDGEDVRVRKKEHAVRSALLIDEETH